MDITAKLVQANKRLKGANTKVAIEPKWWSVKVARHFATETRRL